MSTTQIKKVNFYVKNLLVVVRARNSRDSLNGPSLTSFDESRNTMLAGDIWDAGWRTLAEEFIFGFRNKERQLF